MSESMRNSESTLGTGLAVALSAEFGLPSSEGSESVVSSSLFAFTSRLQQRYVAESRRGVFALDFGQQAPLPLTEFLTFLTPDFWVLQTPMLITC